MGYFGAIQALLYPLFTMTLPFYYMARYWKSESGEEGHKNLSFIMNFLNISNAFVAIIAYMILKYYFVAAKVVFPLMPFFLIVIANLFFEKFKTFYLLECRIHKQGLRFFLINVLQIVVNTAFSLFFVVTLQGGAVGRMSGILLGVIVTGVLSLIILLFQKKYRFSLRIKKKIIPALAQFPMIIGAYAYYPIGTSINCFGTFGRYSRIRLLQYRIDHSRFCCYFFAVYQSFEPDLYKIGTKSTNNTKILGVHSNGFLDACLYNGILSHSVLFNSRTLCLCATVPMYLR